MGFGMKTILNVGCGTCLIHPQFEGWKEVRLDIDSTVKPDIVSDIRCLEVGSEKYDAVYSSHNLEHLYFYEVPVALSEFFRVLCPGGIVFIGVPNLRAVAWKVACGNLEGVLYESSVGPISAIDCIYGCRDFLEKSENAYQQHKTGFTPGTLKKKLETAGFVNIKIDTKGVNMWVSGVKLDGNKENILA